MKDLVIFLCLTLLFHSCLPGNKKIPNLIKIGVTDSFFCNIQSINANVKIHPVHIATTEKPFDYKGCEDLTKNLNAVHGYWIVRTLIDNLKLSKHQYIEIFPVRVFDVEGQTTSDYWTSAINYLQENKADIILSASGVLTEDKVLNTQTPMLLATGTKKSKFINELNLWPQRLGSERIIYFAHYHRSTVRNKERIGFIDKMTLFQNKIDYIVANPNRGLQSSSYALAYGAAKALSLCFRNIESFERSKLKQCLFPHAKSVKILGKKEKYLEL